MPIQSPDLTAPPISVSNLVSFPSPAATVPLIKMAPEIAETIIRDALAVAFLSSPGTVKEIRLLHHVELRLASVREGVDLEINDTNAIEQLWQKNYLTSGWAIRGLAAEFAASGLGLALPNVPRRKSSRSRISASEDFRPAMSRDEGQTGVWKKRVQPDIWEASFGEGRGRIEAVIVVDTDGADATLNWRDAKLESSFDGEWEAKSSTLKLVHELPGWRLVVPHPSFTPYENEA